MVIKYHVHLLYHGHLVAIFSKMLRYQKESFMFASDSQNSLIFRCPNMDSVRNLKFTRNLKFATSKTLVNFMKKMMFLSKNWYFSVQKALIYFAVNKSHHNSMWRILDFLLYMRLCNRGYIHSYLAVGA